MLRKKPSKNRQVLDFDRFIREIRLAKRIEVSNVLEFAEGTRQTQYYAVRGFVRYEVDMSAFTKTIFFDEWKATISLRLGDEALWEQAVSLSHATARHRYEDIQLRLPAATVTMIKSSPVAPFRKSRSAAAASAA